MYEFLVGSEIRSLHWKGSFDKNQGVGVKNVICSDLRTINKRISPKIIIYYFWYFFSLNDYFLLGIVFFVVD